PLRQGAQQRPALGPGDLEDARLQLLLALAHRLGESRQARAMLVIGWQGEGERLYPPGISADQGQRQVGDRSGLIDVASHGASLCRLGDRLKRTQRLRSR